LDVVTRPAWRSCQPEQRTHRNRTSTDDLAGGSIRRSAARVGHIDLGASERDRQRSQLSPGKSWKLIGAKLAGAQHRRRRLRTTVAERVPRRCSAPLGLFDEIARCDHPRFPGLRSAASWAVASRPGWGFKHREHPRSPFLALKGTDSIARGGAWRSPGVAERMDEQKP